MSFSKIIYGDKTLIDLTADTVKASVLLKGYTAHGADGEPMTGTFEGASTSDEIDRILTSGLTDGYKYLLDDGTIISNSPTTGATLTKTFSNDFSTCTTVLTDQDGVELGRTVKTYSDNYQVVTTTDSKDRKLVKTFDDDLKLCESVLTDADGTELARLTKTYSDDGLTVDTTVVYG